MNSQQIAEKNRKVNQPNKQNRHPILIQNKESQFMNHFDSLKNSKISTHPTHNTTIQSDYQHVFEQYSQRQSQVDQIANIFQNGQIFDLLEKDRRFVASNAFLSLPHHLRESVSTVNRFFMFDQPYQTQREKYDIFTSDRMAECLATSIVPSPKIEQMDCFKGIEKATSEKGVAANKTTQKSSNQIIDSKLDLLLVQLSREKQRKDVTKCYQEAMGIKLVQLFDYITENDDQYLGMSLEGKFYEIIRNLSKYRGKQIDGCLKLPLIEYFLTEFKEYQEYRINNIKKSRMEEDKISVYSQKKMKYDKSSKRGKKYSEPNSKRSGLKQQDWIGNL